MEFSKFLSKVRKEKGLTQAELAEKLNVSDKTISKWETGNGFPESTLLVPLADIFDLTVDELLRGEINEKENREQKNRPDNDEKHNEDASLKDFIEKEIKKEKLQSFHKNTLDRNETITVAIAVPIIFIGICISIIIASIGLNYGFYLPVLFSTLAISVGMLSTMGMKKGVKVLHGELTPNIKKDIYLISTGVALMIFSPTCIVCMYPFGVHVAFYMSIFSVVACIALCFLILGGVGYGNFMAQLAINSVGNLNKEEVGFIDKKTRKEKINGAICGCLMMACTIIFLVCGLGFNIWHPSWVVFPVGGLLCGIVSMIMDVKK